MGRRYKITKIFGVVVTRFEVELVKKVLDRKVIISEDHFAVDSARVAAT